MLKLKSRCIAAGEVNYPTQALHVYRLNSDVDSRNALMLDNLAPDNAQYTMKASDSVAGQTGHISLSTLSNNRSSVTGGLHSTLKLDKPMLQSVVSKHVKDNIY